MENPKTEFQVWTKLIFNLLRGHHHLKQMRRGMRTNQLPPSLHGVSDFLSQLASPALPTTATATLLRGNASNWLQMNLQILEQHYEGMIERVRTNLLRPVNIDHRGAWLVALRWATNKYKINEEVVSTVMNDLIGVGLRIDRIAEGSPLRAIMDAPAKRPRPVSHQRSRSTTPRCPIPSTNTSFRPQVDPDDQTRTYTQVDPVDQPRTVTSFEQGPCSTYQAPPPALGPITRQDPPGKTTISTPQVSSRERPPRTTNPNPLTHTLAEPPPPNADVDTDRRGNLTDQPPTDRTTEPLKTASHLALATETTPITPTKLPTRMDRSSTND